MSTVEDLLRVDGRAGNHQLHQPIRVNLRVAHPLVSAGLQAVLREHADIQVTESRDGYHTTLADTSDVIVAESTDAVCRPHGHGRGAAEARASQRIVAVGDGEHEISIVTALCSGVRGFVSCRSVATELPEAVRAVARGDAYLSCDMAGTLLTWLSGQLPADLHRFRRAADLLSFREREVLTLLGNGHSNGEIAASLVISETTVRSHLYHILTKLDLRTRTQAVLFGYQFRLSTGAGHGV